MNPAVGVTHQPYLSGGFFLNFFFKYLYFQISNRLFVLQCLITLFDFPSIFAQFGIPSSNSSKVNTFISLMQWLFSSTQVSCVHLTQRSLYVPRATESSYVCAKHGFIPLRMLLFILRPYAKLSLATEMNGTACIYWNSLCKLPYLKQASGSRF